MEIFVTGIGTDVGKTVAAAAITEALQADYWKPIQSGDFDFGDADRVKSYISNSKTVFHDNAYKFHTPASPHFAAEQENRTIDITQIKRPKTKNSLVIEGAGGILVPLNEQHLVVDLIAPTDLVVVVSRHYLGSINHTLLTVESLRARGKRIAGLVFNGSNPASESIILAMTNLPVIGRLEEEPYIDSRVISAYAEEWSAQLKTLA
ncbi:dethiobiotin synthase [Flavobacterium aurantiibacter]|uniref:ATP-dependent dethiobiotin synthetase BioD n=1 Tax=Flavobacterium aurantiibacter TaxID=2023067 RepID=A0A255ZWJ1_9FLAO|nr:dethiobiotin synthase [Flavobacterium aurantiibacter]OYQ45284.1 dethiobiotin synthase [Flavobacterium aurantiibacter]